MKINVNEMPIQIFDKLDLKRREQFANLIAVLSQSDLSHNRKIVPLVPEQIMNRYLGLVALEDDDFVGYVGANQPLSTGQTDMSKVGSLIVAPMFKRQGVAGALVEGITTELAADEIVPYAFCNAYSIKSFSQAGYEEALPGQLPQGELSQLGNKPMIYTQDLRP